MAQEAELDLVEVAPDAKPPVCRIEDYRKVLYDRRRRARDSKKKHKTVDIKEVKMRLAIDPHDYKTKIEHARDFLDKGNKVKITFMYRGRERAFQDRALNLLDQVTRDLEDVAIQESVSRTNNLLTGAVFAHKK
jgi:translation initiation factor IF-3